MDGFNCKAVCARVDALLKSLIPAVQYSFHNNFSVKSQFCVGLEKSIKHLKELFFQSEALAVGVHYMGGGRKTTLALSICDDPHIKGYFEEVLFITVSQSPNQDVEDARVQLLQQQLIIRQSKRTLALLDNVWSRDNFEKLLFEAPGYKTVITTRDAYTISRNPSTPLYQWPLLSQEYAHSLFCFSDCRQTSISHYCRERLFKCLEISIDFLDDDERECFLDLASFPADKKICADVLLDIWVYVRKMEWQDAFIMLQTFASRNLLNLIINKGSPATISYGSASEVFFSQHKEVRDLALYLGCQDSIVNRKRLLMPMKGHSLARKRKLLSDRAFNAQIVSIHTGSMAENQWYEMNFLETEALVLLFSASEYFLPPFLETMKKLKVLMVCNLSSKRATIKGLDALSSLTQLRSVHLERLVAPTFPKQSKVIQNLDKLSLSLCEGFVNMSTFNDTDLHEFTLDHCSDLEELPPAICHMPSAQTWSVTNCHLVEKLPHDLGNLSSLKVLRLSALPCLKELPASIGKLGQLEYLDISLCEGLKELPEEIGQLKQLKKIDMRECSSLRRLPRSVCGLSSLEHVICADLNDPLWSAKCLITTPELIRQVHEEYLEAGAEIIITASYQATIQGFESKGLSTIEGEALLRRSVEIACEARDNFWKKCAEISDGSVEYAEIPNYQPVLVAASIGSYGAYLADGSEYSGDYGPGMTLQSLKDFHRRRVQVLADSGADLLAFETIPNKLEAQVLPFYKTIVQKLVLLFQAYVELLEEDDIQVPAWFTFNSKDGVNVVSGDSVTECASLADSCKKVVAIGINCTTPRFIHGLIVSIQKVTEKPILIYPNSGETYDAVRKEWVASTGVSDVDFVSYVRKWQELGASLIGGCCRTTPNTIKAIARTMNKRPSYTPTENA